MQNRVKDFLRDRRLTVYQFIKETGIAPTTGYKLARDPNHLPSIRVLETLCDHYQVEPGELIERVPTADQ